MTTKLLVVVLIGPTGSGKTNFINQLMGSKEDHMAHQLDTQAIREFTVNLSNNQQYVFVDTPGFDDGCQSARDILRTIAEWLEKKYRNNVNLTGIIYTHRITDNRMSGSVCENIDMFGRLCGDTATERVRLVTTMWDNVKDAKVAESRVLQLEGNFWKPLIDTGARHEQFKNTSTSAWEIVRGLMPGGREAVLTQEEFVDAERRNETIARDALHTQYQEDLHEQKETMQQIQEEARALNDPELVKQLEAEQRCWEAELRKTSDYDIRELKISFFRRAALLCSRRTETLSREVQLSQFGKLPEIAKHDYVIFVVGPAGAGKSWFTRQFLKHHDLPVASTSGHLRANEVKAVRCNVSTNLGNVVFVDVPSFHIDREGFDAEDMMTKWLNSQFINKCHPGVIFLHSLDFDPTHDGMLMSRHLGTFAKAFPNTFTVPSRVYVVPTSKPASTVPTQRLSQRLSQLETIMGELDGKGNHKWHASMFPGVFRGQPETAWSAALLLLKGMAETEVNFSHTYIALEYPAHFLFQEFRVGASNGDLSAIITLGRTALEFTPLEHPQRHSILVELADLLSERFIEEGRKEDLDELITLKRAASEYISLDDSQRQISLRELDDSLYERFRTGNSMVDLEKIISLRRVTLELTPQPDRCNPLHSLADSLYERFQTLHSVSDIEEALRLVHTASQLCPLGHPDLALSQVRLARYLKAKVREGTARAHVNRLATDPSSSNSSNIEQLIDKVVSETLENFPPRLLHTSTGVLCNRDAQLSNFKRSLQYQQLLSSMSSLSSQQFQTKISDTVPEYFGFVMLSHRWGRGEPLLRDIEGKQIYDLTGTDGLAKLQDFCILVCERGFQWAWSDTCCIDKDSSAELQEAIGSMFSWYRRSSVTIVYLSDVSNTGPLANSVWFKRGWTLQELLASRTVLFYTHDWSLYMNRDTPNHKTDTALLQEVEKITGIAKQHLMDFYPGLDNARSRLHWASRRRTTRPEDIAYSLFGIFKVHLPIFYGESVEHALGRLLAEIISASGDVSVLDWVGKASSFNSCFPANLLPYQTVPCIQLISSDPTGCRVLDFDKTQKLYNILAGLPRAGFLNNKLMLPAIIHQVTAVRLQGSSNSPSRYTYEIYGSCLRPVIVTLSVKLGHGPGTYILVRLWHPKSLETQAERDDNAVWNLLEQLGQPFNALLLKRLLHNEYKRIASDCTITVCVQDVASILDSEVLILEIV